VVADMNRTEEEELMPLVLTTMGAVETPWIGGTGIMLLDIGEVPLTLSDIEVPIPLAAQAEVFEFPETFSSPSDEPS
jgi:hypothetical protein